jgi:two-component system, chemotaxis family, chemotaxis protein CheY
MSTEAKSVLIAEDNAALARVVSFTLARCGFDVTTARDGQEAWEHAQKRPFALVISDQQMPRMTGLELCERLRSTAEHAATPIVLLTAKGMEIEAERVREQYGVSELLLKPFSPAHLAETADRLLAVPV